MMNAQATTNRQPASNDYLVGYRKPPKATRFKKGQSGNPRGRPKSKDKRLTHYKLMDIVRQEGDRPLPGGNGEIKMAEAVVRSTIADAVRGNATARRVIIPLFGEAYGEQVEPGGTVDPKSISELSDEELALLEKIYDR